MDGRSSFSGNNTNYIRSSNCLVRALNHYTFFEGKRQVCDNIAPLAEDISAEASQAYVERIFVCVKTFNSWEKKPPAKVTGNKRVL